ncbi:MAG: HAD family hydrolase [Acidobacteriota bacterium]
MRPQIITFDCYGTLIDWNTGITEAFQGEGKRRGFAVADEAEILSVYHEVEPQVQARRYRPYRQILEELESAVASRLGWKASSGSRGFLAASLPSWPPFAETNPALRKLRKAGLRLGILSNIDDDLLAGTLEHLEVKFDLLVTAQQVRSYKPAAEHFKRALMATDGSGDGLLHVAQSYFHDVHTAATLGIRTIWVNRAAEACPADGCAPTAEVKNLSEAVNWIEEFVAGNNRPRARRG